MTLDEFFAQARTAGMPTLASLYCCEGGDSVGYNRAGFAVFGVDLFEDHTQARYPFPSHKGDAIEFIKEHGHRFDAVHASPPCQDKSAGTRSLRKNDGVEYPRLIPPTRDALQATGLPYVIENVRGAQLINPIELCGCMFGLTTEDDDGLPLRLERARLFESNIELPQHDHHHDPDVWVAGCYGGSRRQGDTPAERRWNAKKVRKGGYVPSKAVCQRLLGIDWMTWKGMHQALPPVYTEHIGNHLARVVSDSVRPRRNASTEDEVTDGR